MQLFRHGITAGVAAFAVLLGGSAVPAVPEWHFSGVERIVAVSDIHGAYSSFEKILQAAGVIDTAATWTGGTTHLVIVGDVLDRGPESRRAMDLIMRLERQAPEHGGRVHFPLGNHEIMNLTGDLRYVSAAEYATFAADEPAGQRAAALQIFLAGAQDEMERVRLSTEFDARFPPGFFGHRRAFSPDGEYGSWLLAHPLLVVINDTAFVHAGLAEALIGLDGSRINAQLMQHVTDYLAHMRTLDEAGVLPPTVEFLAHPDWIDRFQARVTAGELAWPERAQDAASALRSLHSELVFASESPVWYRGNVGCSALIEQDRLEAALGALGARRVVVGHTPTPEARVLSRLDGAVLRVDTGMLKSYYGGRAAALVVENGALAVLYEDEAGASPPQSEPRRVGARPVDLSVEALEAALASGEVLSRTAIDDTTALVRLRHDALEIEALFVRAERGNFRPDVAAYRLDRLLGLDLVPVTVPRELEGQAGSLQYVAPQVITETERSAQGLGADAWCPLRDQFQAMYVFDSLIFNQGRTPDRIRYGRYDFGLLLVGHDRAFSLDRGRPAYLAQAPLELTPAWRNALAALDESQLREVMAGVLDRRRIQALLRRRDELLAGGG